LPSSPPPPTLARAIPDPEPAASAAEVKTEGACVVPSPRPLLNKDKYSDREFEFGPDNTSIERASSGTVRVEIRFSGCRGGFEHSFAFVEEAPHAPFYDRDHWLRFAAAQLKTLQTYHRGLADVQDLLDFLSGATIATTRKNGPEIRLEVCRDGSPFAKNGCPAKSGGWRFAVRELDRGRIQVTVSRYLPPK
ncbi:MAG: hypothetical protein ACHQ2Z_16215, partial [Elusimicrobiota bacterium]